MFNYKRVKDLENHIYNLITARDNDQETIKGLKIDLKKLDSQYIMDISKLDLCLSKHEDKHNVMYDQIAAENFLIEKRIISTLYNKLYTLFKAGKYMEVLENNTRVEESIREDESFKKQEYPESIDRPKLHIGYHDTRGEDSTATVASGTCLSSVLAFNGKQYSMDDVETLGYTVKDRAEQFLIKLNNKILDFIK